MVELLAHYIISLIEATNYVGIFILMFLESALIPIPSEVTMPFGGFLVSQGKLDFWGVVIAGTIANLAGSLLAYYVGYILEETILIGIIKRYGKFILVSVEDYNHARKWFEKYGDKVVFISRILPAVRTVISLPAGAFKMNLKKFIIYTTIGCLIWSIFLTYIGVALGENWNSLEKYFREFQILIAVLFILAVLWYINHKLKLLKFNKLFK
ncbi:MAG: DedA family protein [Candidatus Levybacteria bacterium]|nr:DedA family protein [Candidatus Levybacteria bacterium]